MFQFDSYTPRMLQHFTMIWTISGGTPHNNERLIFSGDVNMFDVKIWFLIKVPLVNITIKELFMSKHLKSQGVESTT